MARLILRTGVVVDEKEAQRLHDEAQWSEVGHDPRAACWCCCTTCGVRWASGPESTRSDEGDTPPG